MFTSDEIKQIEDIELRHVHALFEDGGLYEQSTSLFVLISTNAELFAFACIKRTRDIFIAISHMKKYSDQQVADGEVPILPNPMIDISFRSCLETVAFGWWILDNQDKAISAIKKDWEIRQGHRDLLREYSDEAVSKCVDPIALYKEGDISFIDIDDLITVEDLPSCKNMISEMEKDLETIVSIPMYKILSHYSTHTTLSSLWPYMHPGLDYGDPSVGEVFIDFFKVSLYGLTVELLKKLVVHLNVK